MLIKCTLNDNVGNTCSKSEISGRGGTVSRAMILIILDFVFYSLPQPIMSNADLNRLINSEEIQSVVKPAG